MRLLENRKLFKVGLKSDSIDIGGGCKMSTKSDGLLDTIRSIEDKSLRDAMVKGNMRELIELRKYSLVLGVFSDNNDIEGLCSAAEKIPRFIEEATGRVPHETNSRIRNAYTSLPNSILQQLGKKLIGSDIKERYGGDYRALQLSKGIEILVLSGDNDTIDKAVRDVLKCDMGGPCTRHPYIGAFEGAQKITNRNLMIEAAVKASRDDTGIFEYAEYIQRQFKDDSALIKIAKNLEKDNKLKGAFAFYLVAKDEKGLGNLINVNLENYAYALNRFFRDYLKTREATSFVAEQYSNVTRVFLMNWRKYSKELSRFNSWDPELIDEAISTLVELGDKKVLNNALLYFLEEQNRDLKTAFKIASAVTIDDPVRERAGEIAISYISKGEIKTGFEVYEKVGLALSGIRTDIVREGLKKALEEDRKDSIIKGFRYLHNHDKLTEDEIKVYSHYLKGPICAHS